jgi:alkyldihydroxyacetonephosphate synthase
MQGSERMVYRKNDGRGIAAKWWGWGDPSKSFSLEGRQGFVEFLKGRLDVSMDPVRPPVSFEQVRLGPCRLDGAELGRLERRTAMDGILREPSVRIGHAMGKSYRDLVRIRRGEVGCAPDAVVYPSREEDIAAVLDWASEANVAVVPFGGGTSVVGGVEAFARQDQKGIVSLDLSRLNRVLRVDRLSRLARVQAGIRGPELEGALNQEGFTLGHFPQSFEYSTAGGWVATRSAGQQSTLYGKIEHMVLSVRMVHPGGVLETLTVPARAAGPDWNQIVAGSEGILGVISEITFKLQPLPLERRCGAFFFRSFEKGVDACREILQNGLAPAVLRLSDGDETDFGMRLRPKSAGRGKRAVEGAGVWALERMGYRPESRCLLILGFEGSRDAVHGPWKRAKEVCSDHGGFFLGAGPGELWYRERFEHPYLRDVLLDRGVLIDTLETSATWENLLGLYQAVRQSLEASIAQTGVRGLVMAHLSHCYPCGSSLYFIFLARQTAGAELDQWWTIKKAASDCILERGGTISHHHGVGMDHAPWAEREHGTSAMAGLRKLKAGLDPRGVLNPGKVLTLSV